MTSQHQISLSPCVHSRRHSFISSFMKLNQNVRHNDILSNSNVGPVWSKTSSLDQISLKPWMHSRGHNFASIFMLLIRIFILMISVKFEYGSCRVKKLGHLVKFL